MLNNLDEKVAYCYRRAGECKELADLAAAPNDKAFYIEREQGWLLLARSYELQNRSALFAKEHHRRLGSGRVLACPDCKALTQLCWTMFVCTNCRRVVEGL